MDAKEENIAEPFLTGQTERQTEPESKVKKKLVSMLNDLRKTHLIWVKIVFLLQSASLVTLYPYLSIHMRSLGFSVEDASVVNTAIPVADVVGPPLAGLIADKLGNFRIFAAVITFLNGASALALLAIPSTLVSFEMCCDSNNVCYTEETDIYCDSLSLLSVNLTTTPSSTIGDCETTYQCHVTPLKSSVDSPAFWQYFAIRIILDILKGASLVLFEGAVMAIIKQHGGDIGLQKLFSTFGGLIFGPIAGAMIDIQSFGYMSVILMFFGLRFAASLCLLNLKLDFKPPAKYIFKDLIPTLCKVTVIMNLFAFFSAGFMWGFLETFLFWFLEDLGASKLLMGLSTAVATLTGLPITIYSHFFIKKLKHERIVILSLSCFGLRMLGYSFIHHPALFLILEALKPISVTLLIISTFDYIKTSAPLTTYATVNALFGAAYFGIGRGAGGFASGYATAALGFRTTFQVFSSVSFGVAIIYAIVMFIDSCLAPEEGKTTVVVTEPE